MRKLIIPWSLNLSAMDKNKLLEVNGFNIKRPIGIKNDEDVQVTTYSQEENI